MNWRHWLGCDFGLHAWSKWIDGKTYATKFRNHDVGAGIVEGIPYWINNGEELSQTRTCSECGMKQSRSINV